MRILYLLSLLLLCPVISAMEHSNGVVPMRNGRTPKIDPDKLAKLVQAAEDVGDFTLSFEDFAQQIRKEDAERERAQEAARKYKQEQRALRERLTALKKQLDACKKEGKALDRKIKQERKKLEKKEKEYERLALRTTEPLKGIQKESVYSILAPESVDSIGDVWTKVQDRYKTFMAEEHVLSADECDGFQEILVEVQKVLQEHREAFTSFQKITNELLVNKLGGVIASNMLVIIKQRKKLLILIKQLNHANTPETIADLAKQVTQHVATLKSMVNKQEKAIKKPDASVPESWPTEKLLISEVHELADKTIHTAFDVPMGQLTQQLLDEGEKISNELAVLSLCDYFSKVAWRATHPLGAWVALAKRYSAKHQALAGQALQLEEVQRQLNAYVAGAQEHTQLNESVQHAKASGKTTTQLYALVTRRLQVLAMAQMKLAEKRERYSPEALERYQEQLASLLNTKCDILLVEAGDCGACKKHATLRCAKCKRIFYCSKECQRSHWKTHKKECKKVDLEQLETEIALLDLRRARAEEPHRYFMCEDGKSIYDEIGRKYTIAEDNMTITGKDGEQYSLVGNGGVVSMFKSYKTHKQFPAYVADGMRDSLLKGAKMAAVKDDGIYLSNELYHSIKSQSGECS